MTSKNHRGRYIASNSGLTLLFWAFLALFCTSLWYVCRMERRDREGRLYWVYFDKTESRRREEK